MAEEKIPGRNRKKQEQFARDTLRFTNFTPHNVDRFAKELLFADPRIRSIDFVGLFHDTSERGLMRISRDCDDAVIKQAIDTFIAKVTPVGWRVSLELDGVLWNAESRPLPFLHDDFQTLVEDLFTAAEADIAEADIPQSETAMDYVN